MASVIVPYPTRSEISKRVAAEYYTPMLFSKKNPLVGQVVGNIRMNLANWIVFSILLGSILWSNIKQRQ